MKEKSRRAGNYKSVVSIHQMVTEGNRETWCEIVQNQRYNQEHKISNHHELFWRKVESCWLAKNEPVTRLEPHPRTRTQTD